MLQVEAGRSLRRLWLAVAGVCLLLAIALLLLPASWPGHLTGMVVALIAAPIGFVICLRPITQGRAWLVWAVVPASIIVADELTWLVPPDTILPMPCWLVVGAVFSALAFLVSRSGHVRRRASASAGVVALGVLWWSCWAVFLAHAVPSPRSHGFEFHCGVNLKMIARAALEYRQKFGGPFPEVSDLLAQGMLRESRSRCPLGPAYTSLVTVPPGDGEQGTSYVLLCAAHRDKIVAVGEDCRIWIFDARRPDIARRMYWKFVDRFGPPPWWR